MKLFLSLLLLAGVTASAQAPAKKPAPTPAPTATAKAETKPAPMPAATGFVGNSNSKVFHKSDCKAVATMKAGHKVAFATKAEAEKAGFKACKICKP
jgi:hypothetical protein